MNDSSGVRCAERVRDLTGEKKSLGWRERTTSDPFGKRLAVEVLHDEKIDTFLTADIMQNANMRMVQTRNYLSFAFESQVQLWLIKEVSGQNFDCDRPVESRVERTVNLTHAACANSSGNFVRSECPAWRQRTGDCREPVTCRQTCQRFVERRCGLCFAFEQRLHFRTQFNIVAAGVVQVGRTRLLLQRACAVKELFNLVPSVHQILAVFRRLHLADQPGPRHRPIVQNRVRRYLERFGNLLSRQAAEKS